MSAKRPELLLFDAAGTLIEPAEPVEQVYARHFAARGWVTDTAVIRSAFRATFGGLGDPKFAGHATGEAAEREWWRKVVLLTAISAGVDPGHDLFESCFEDLFSHYAAGSAWKCFPEVEEVLRDATASGFKLAVVSNFDRRLHRVLDELALTHHFDLVLTSADVGARKPSPALLKEAMKRLGATAETTSIVGDSETADGGAAKAAGVSAFIVDRPEITLRNYLGWVSGNFS